MSEDMLAGLNDMTAAMGNEETASDASAGQKGLDYSQLDYDVVIFTPAADRKENRFDIIPFIVSEEWYENLLFPPPSQAQREAGMTYARQRGRKVGQADVCLEIPFHRWAAGESGDAVCLREAFGKKCPHCERMFEEYANKKNGDPEADEKAKSLKPSWRTFFNIYNHLPQNTKDAPADHDGYEVIDDMGRGSLMKYIQICSKDTDVGENFVYPYAHPTDGYTLSAKSFYQEATSKKFKKGHTEFSDINFIKRAADDDFTDDMTESVGFDKLASKLIYSYEEMAEMLRKKMGDAEPQEEDAGAVDAPINTIPDQETGQTHDGEKIDDAPAFQQKETSSRRNRAGRRSPAKDTEQKADSAPEQEEKKADPASSSRRRRR